MPDLRIQQAQKHVAPVLAFLMPPLAFTAYTMAAWRLGADLHWLGEFVISKGLLSRWQVWLAIAIAAQVTVQQANRAGKASQPRSGA